MLNQLQRGDEPALLPCRRSGFLRRPEIVLNKPGVSTLVGEGKAAGVAQHVGMVRYRELGLLAVFAQGEVGGSAVQRLPLLTEEERPP